MNNSYLYDKFGNIEFMYRMAVSNIKINKILKKKYINVDFFIALSI